MKKRTWQKLLCCIVTGVFVIGCFTGCGSKEKEEAKEEVEVATEESSEEPTIPEEETDEEVTLTIAWYEEAQVTAHAENLADTAFGKAWQEATGVKLEVLQMADDQAYSLMFAGGELPDIIWYGFNGYPGGPQGAIEDGIIEPLNNYMEYAPDLQALLDNRELYKQSVTTPDGEIIGFPWIRDDSEPGALNIQGIVIRQDWLDELGLNYPKTADEFYDVLKRFKEEKGAEYPLSSYSTDHFRNAVTEGIITSPFGLVKGDFYKKDGQVHYGYAENEYKDVLVWLNEMYEEGLIDPNFAAMDSAAFDANMTSGVTGVGFISCNTANRLVTAVEETDPEFDLIGIPPLSTPDGDVSMSTQYSHPVTGMYAVITPACENKEAAVKFLNYAYTEEGSMLFNYGIEGESYEMVDGTPTETELITNHPEGWAPLEARAYYQRNWQSAPMVQLYIPAGVPERTQITKANFGVSNVEEYLMPQLFFDEDVSSEISKCMSDIITLRDEMFTKFVMGTESLDNFEEYVETLYELGLDKVLAYYQEGLDAYSGK